MVLTNPTSIDTNWTQGDSLTGASGNFNFNASKEGTWQFYTQAYDKAGNAESIPVSTTIAKAQTFYDGTPPIISNIKTTALSPDSTLIEWITDDKTTGVVEIPLSPSLSKWETGGFAKTHSVTLTNLPNPADIYFKITATNRIENKKI